MFAAIVFALMSIGSADAHARLKESTPARSEVLGAPPSQVSITFTQDVQKITGTYGIDVTDEAGTDVTTGDAVLDDADRTLMTVGLQPNLPPGRYVVQYRNVSDADGDPFAAGFAFYVGVEPTEEQLAADAQLEPEEETPQPTGTASTPAPEGTPPASATAVAPSDGDGGGSNSALIIIAVIVVVGLIIGFFGYRFVAQRRA
jgi:methionine-rich copper-binding protein CopC